jgi:hypothetical protein
MKLAELRVREEITGILLARVKIKDDYEWKGHIGEIWVESKMIGEKTIINCYYSSIQFIRLVVLENKTIQFKVAPVGQGLTQLRWLLEQIKKR